MKKFSKRMLSFVLSAVMVVTMLPTFVLFSPDTATATESEDTLFHYTFNSGSLTDSVNSSYSLTQGDDWGNDVSSTGEALTYTDSFNYGKVNSKIRSNKYKNHWKMTFDFTFNNTRCRDTEFILSLASSNGAEPFFGLTNTGKVKVDGGALTDTSTRFGSGTENNSSQGTYTYTIPGGQSEARHTLIYEYNNGTITVKIDGSTIHTASGVKKGYYENVTYIALGGYSGQGSGLKCYDLIAEGYAAADTADYWQIMASTDFSALSFENNNDNWSYTGNRFTATNTPTVAGVGGNSMKWGAFVWENNTNPIVNADGFNSNYTDSSKAQSFLYLKEYNNQTTDKIFKDVSNFKIDIEFKLTDTTKYGSQDADSRRRSSFVTGDYATFVKLATDSDAVYTFKRRNPDEGSYMYFTQEAWGRRHIQNNKDIYAVSGTQEGASYAITTNNPNMSAGNTYHYVIYYADGYMCSVVLDNNDVPIIAYDPIEIDNYNPANITGIYLGTSNGNYMCNIAYKNIKIYKGVDTSSYDSSRDKYLLTYFIGDKSVDEKLHYAVSDDGVNFTPLNDSKPVWNRDASWSITSYPTTDSAPNADGIAVSKHTRDSYAFIGENGKCYVIATDLKTDTNDDGNPDWGPGAANYEKNSCFLVWEMDSFAEIDTTTPWAIDTSKISGMDEILKSGGTYYDVEKAWAPQAIWDSAVGKYMLYWTVGTSQDYNNKKMYYIYTSDFKTFEGTPKRLVYPSAFTNHIDGDITYYNGLYYMFFKNEDESGTNNKKLFTAVAPSASGPYTNIQYYSDGSANALEGPEVYQIAANQYAFITDAYTQSNQFTGTVVEAFTASTPGTFNSSSTSTTNLGELRYRHGSVVPITTSEYNNLISHFGSIPDGNVEYHWATDSSGNYVDPVIDTTGYRYHTLWKASDSYPFSAVDGLLTINGNCVFVGENEVDSRNIYTSDAWTIKFKHAVNSSYALETKTAFAIGHPSKDFIRLCEDGKFKVYKDGALTTVCTTSISTDYNNMDEFTITYNGFAVQLLKNGTYVGGSVFTEKIEPASNILYLSLGWSDSTGDGNKDNIAYYGALKLSPTAITTGQEETFINGVCSESDVAASSIKTFTADAYHENEIATNGYSNVIYTGGAWTTDWDTYSYSSTTASAGGDWDSNKHNNNEHYGKIKNLRYKVPMQSESVIAYDGVNTAKVPIEIQFRNYKNYRTYIRKIYYHGTSAAGADSTKFSLNDYWYGCTYDSWETNAYRNWLGDSIDDTNYLNYDKEYKTNTDSSNTEWYGKISSQSDVNRQTCYQQTDNWIYYWNAVNYTGGDFAADTYSAAFTKFTFAVESSTDGGYNNFTTEYIQNSDSKVYVINYKPIYDILKSNGTTINIDGQNMTISQLRTYLISGDGAWKYTTASRIEALNRMKAVGAVDPGNTTTYTYSSNCASAVTSAATAIKTAYDNYMEIEQTVSNPDRVLKTKEFTISFEKYNGTKTSTVVTAGNDIAHNKDGDSIPSQSAPIHIVGSNYHKLNHWTACSGVWNYGTADQRTATPSGTHVPHSNELYVETTDVEPEYCESLGTRIPDDPGLTYNEGTGTYTCDTGWTHHDGATSDDNGYCTSYCTVCSGSEKVWDKHPEEWAVYDEYVDMKDDTTGYTIASRGEYETQIASITSDVTAEDETKSKSFIDGKNTALATAANTYLNPLAEYSLLDDALEGRRTERLTNNYSGANQLYTYTSWVNFASKYAAGNTLLNTTYTAEQKADQGKYTVNEGTNTVNNGEGGRSEETSSYQNDIVDKKNAVIGATLTAITDQDSFTTYNTSRDVSRGTLDKGNNVGGVYQYDGKYTEAAIDHVEDAITDADGYVYHKLTAEDYEAYNTSTGKSLAVGTEIKNTADADTYTGNVLGAVADINNAANKATYINQFWVKYKVQDDKGTTIGDVTTQTKYYGETVDLTVDADALTDRTLSIWSTSVYPGTSTSDIAAKPRSSQKNATNSTTTITKIVNANMFVTAEVTNDTFTGYTNRFSIYDAYRHLAKIEFNNATVTLADGNYSTSELNTALSLTLTDPVVPLYNFTNWTFKSEGNGDYKIIPNFTVTQTYAITADGVALGAKQYDQRVYLSYSGNDFVAWAENHSGKLKIASYSKNYSFFACAIEDYVVLVNDGGVVKVKGSENAVKASDICGTFTSTGNQSADDFVQSMLLSKAPFISIQGETHSSTKVRVFCRVTEGATGTEGFGVLFRKDLVAASDEQMVSGYNGTLTRTVTSVLDSGQYTYTLNNNKGGFSVGNVIPFRAFANYKFNYTVGETTYNNFNGTAYSDVVNVTIS